MSKLRDLSINLGLIPPEQHSAHSNCCHAVQKAETPTLAELELSARRHRNRKMDNSQNEFFKACIDKVTEYEVDILKLLKLPDINIVRAAVAGEKVPEKGMFSKETCGGLHTVTPCSCRSSGPFLPGDLFPRKRGGRGTSVSSRKGNFQQTVLPEGE